MENGDQPLAPHLDVKDDISQEDTRVLVLRGELDLATVGRLRERLAPLIEDSAVQLVVVDLVEVTFIDSTGLMTLLNALRRLVRRGARLVLACNNPTVLRLFEATKTDHTFEIVPTREQALP